MSSVSFVTLRLGKDSVDDIKTIDALPDGVQNPAYRLNVVCKQVPRTLQAGTYAVIWLGSDNSKGMPTTWKQGIRAIARIEEVQFGEKHNDDSSIDLSIGYIFKNSIDKIGLLENYPTAYIHFVEAPLVGLNDYSNQTVREIDASPRSNIGALLAACGRSSSSSIEGIVKAYPDLREVIRDGLSSIEATPTYTDDLMAALAPEISEPRNLIFFGAPGTGKSHNLNKLAKANFSDSHIRRVTFYPDYTYSQFVGCFKPVAMKTKGEDGKTTSEISYRYVLGPFLETYVNAVKSPEQNYLLIVEEINRANPAAVFGDVFQLLDRDKDGTSAYDVDAPVEMRDRLADELDAEVDKLKIPANMFIWATMNSADQGVFPMDTAFKRRWSFRYIGIDDGEDAEIDGEKLSDKVVTCGGRRVYWNRLRKAINDLMAHDCDINEDKLLGPFFLDPSALNDEQFADAFKDKVLMYLYEDAGKARRKTLFREKGITYSQLCSAFDREGELVFGGNFDDWGILADQEYEIDDEQSTE